LEVLFVLETTDKKGIYVDRFLPTIPLRVVVNHIGDEVTADYPIEFMNQHLNPAQLDDLLSDETFENTILPNMLKTAEEIAEQLKTSEVKSGLELMSQTLDHEIGRLATLHKRNKAIRPDEVRRALAEKNVLTTLIANANIRMDSLQLIKEGDA
jgi:ATP-dependent helicase HepA